MAAIHAAVQRRTNQFAQKQQAFVLHATPTIGWTPVTNANATLAHALRSSALTIGTVKNKTKIFLKK